MGDRVTRDGKVAVLVSPGYGAGWSTWNSDQCVFEPLVVDWLEQGKPYPVEQLARELEENGNIDGLYMGGVDNLVIEWLPVGTQFAIMEYDGSEYILTKEDLNFTA